MAGGGAGLHEAYAFFVLLSGSPRRYLSDWAWKEAGGSSG